MDSFPVQESKLFIFLPLYKTKSDVEFHNLTCLLQYQELERKEESKEKSVLKYIIFISWKISLSMIEDS